MDLFCLHAVIGEAAPLLIGRRLHRAYESDEREIALDFNLRDGRKLLISTDPQRLSIHLTSRPLRGVNPAYSKPRTDSAFPALLKKHLRPRRVTTAELLGYDRVVRLVFSEDRIMDDDPGSDDGSDSLEGEMHLYIQLTGRSADAVLTRGTDAIASLRRRELNHGYVPPSPPTDLFDPFLLSEPQWLAIIERSGSVFDAGLRLIGFTELYARELEYLARKKGAWKALEAIRSGLEYRDSRAFIYSRIPITEFERTIGREDVELILTTIRLEHLSGYAVQEFDSANEAADRYFRLKQSHAEFSAQRRRTRTVLVGSLKKLETLRSKLQAELQNLSSVEISQRRGELLLSNLHQAEKVGDSFLVVDYYQPDAPRIAIPAEGRPTAREAADHYFKLARKARNGRKAIGERIPAIEAEISAKNLLLEKMERCVEPDQLLRLSANTATLRSPSSRSRSTGTETKTKVSEKIPGARRYRTSDGYEVLVGRTDRDNDYLTLRVAKSLDLWFHAADYPGSHVVLRNPKRTTVPQRSIVEAAQLAAKFSQARNDTRVAVNYCEKKFVSKPKGFAPGQVRLSSFKTVMVEPRELDDRVF
ncbi:MAG: NFACT family protein [Acidobacteria bacterium]|nr:NFACT family protein [Acidobacteriota bacterium]MCW5967390.1 NFACT family protein [Blastocatellales bacterium]